MKTLPELNSVLFVEDDPDTRAAVRFALQDLHRIHVRVCGSAREGLKAAAAFSANLILLDVMMPEIDGPSLLAGLRQADMHRDTPAIFLTSLVQADDLRYYRSLGVTGVIAKPFDPLALKDNIVEILATQANEPAREPPAMEDELQALHRVFARELPLRMERIRGAIEQCRVDPVARGECASLWELIEDLGNVVSTYGNHRIADAARRAEQRVAGLVLNPARSSRDLIEIEMELMAWAL